MQADRRCGENQLEEALLLCVRADRTAAQNERLRLRLGEPGFDWQAFWSLAERQHVQSLVARELAGAVSDAVDEGTLDVARALRLRTMLYNMAIHTEMQRLVDLLSGRGIPVAPLKGTWLAQRLFGTLDARRCGDIDLLVPESCRDVALSILHEAGYSAITSSKPGLKSHAFHGTPLLRAAADVNFIVELHWKLTDPRFVCVDHDALWQRMGVTHERTRTNASLPVEELLLFLAIHLPKHDTGVLRLVVDIDRLVRETGPTLDWTRLLACAEQWKASRLLYYGLHFASTLLGTPFPPDVRERIHPPRWNRYVVGMLTGPSSIILPPASNHLRANRFRLAYCVMLGSPGRMLTSYWNYILAPASDEAPRFVASMAGFMKRMFQGLVWTGASFATSLWEQRGQPSTLTRKLWLSGG